MSVLVDRQAYGDVQEAFKCLTQRQFDCWWDVKVRKLTPTQTAAKRGLTPQTVRGHVARATSNLEKKLSERQTV